MRVPRLWALTAVVGVTVTALATAGLVAPPPAAASPAPGKAMTRTSGVRRMPPTLTIATPPTPCANDIASWPVSRMLAQLLMLTGTFTRPATLAPAAAAGVGDIELAWAPGVEAGTTPATVARIHAEIGSLVSDATSAGQVAPMISTDDEGGIVTRLAGMLGALPAPREMASRWTTMQLEQVMATRGRQIKALGIGMDTAPLYDTAAATSTTTDEGSRTFSTSPTVASAYANAFSRGLASAGVLSVAKEFPGEGHADADTDWEAGTDPPLATLRTHDLISFEKAVAANIPVIMVGHVVVPGLTDGRLASLSPATYALLRGTMGFTGLTITDTMGAKAISLAGYSEAQASLLAVEAGADMPMLNASTWQPALSVLEQAVSSGALPMSVVRTRVAHVLATKGICARAPLIASP